MIKDNENYPHLQAKRLPAGLLPGDFSLELFGVRETRKVFALSDGSTIPFNKIPPEIKALLFEQMLRDDIAMDDLKDLPHDEALEEYAFCMYGAADSKADFTPDGLPGEAENFICGVNCRCLQWRKKQLTLNGNRLTPHEVRVIHMLASDRPDKQVAAELSIAPATLDTHKNNIYKKGGVQSKAGLITEAINQNVIH